MGRRTFFIINPAAGGRCLERWQAFAAKLRRLQIEFDQAITAAPGAALDLARQNAGSYDVIAAVGGDGTVSEAVNGILTSGRTERVALTIVPFGTGNDSAATIGIRTETDALAAVSSGSLRAIDLIEIQCRLNDSQLVRYAMLFASVGISSDLLKYTTPRLKALCGRRLAYIAGLLFALRSHASPEMKITCDDQTRYGRFIFACASNGETFGAGIRVAPGARPDDGKLNVNLIEAVSRWDALKHLKKLRQGRHTTHPKVCYKTALDLRIETDPPIEVAADGDLVGHTPARFRICPRALHVLTH
jgi:diacylglycerol kinase (ATP)